jgi:hypothetical protein
MSGIIFWAIGSQKDEPGYQALLVVSGALLVITDKRTSGIPSSGMFMPPDFTFEELQ